LAAIHLTQPCWLENISQIGCSQTGTTVPVMAVYLQLTGVGQQGANVQQLYRALLLNSGHNTPVLHSFEYSQQQGVLAEVFDFASIRPGALIRVPVKHVADDPCNSASGYDKAQTHGISAAIIVRFAEEINPGSSLY
jgi:hypothetical protein